MLRNRRRQIGFVIGEAVQCGLMALGLIFAVVIVLNGFDLMATARFVSNFATRMTEAEGARAETFVRSLMMTFIALAGLVAVIRFADRATLRRRAL